MRFDRQQGGFLSTWWWTVDRILLFTVLAIIAVGALLVTTASPAVAERIGLDSFYFIRLQLMYLCLSVVVLLLVSFVPVGVMRKLSFIGFAIGIVLMVGVLLFGAEIKGAQRWITFAGLTLQPSEFMKPVFIVMTAALLARWRLKQSAVSGKLVIFSYILLVSCLVMQPDFGMTVVVSLVWAAQVFLSGVPLILVIGLGIIGIIGAVMAYLMLPHVTQRVDLFLGQQNTDMSYQIRKSLEAFENGGFFGVGPGEGVVKQHLPDSHTDFIFAVAGEELGMIACLLIMLMYAYVVIRGLRHLQEETDLFIVYAVAGLLMQFGLQAMINMGVSLNVLPTKGMTLPFISYGGSSMLSLALSMGMVLALTKRRFGKLLRRERVSIELYGIGRGQHV